MRSPTIRTLAGAAFAVMVGLSAACATDTPKPDPTPAAQGDDKEGTASDVSEQVRTVRFGYIADYNGTSLLAIAEDQGLWEAHGLKVEPMVFTNGPLQIQALGTADLDFGYIGPGAFWLPASGKAPIVSLNSTGTADRVIARPDAGIATVADLKGKTVAVPEGTSGDMILSLALDEAGLTPTDINRVVMDPAAIVAAFAAGQVDAAGLWYPAVSTIKEQVPDLLELAKNTDFADTMAFPSAFVTRPELPQEDPDLINDVVAVLKEANDYRYNNPDETIELAAAMLNVEPDKVKADAANVQPYTSAQLEEMTTDGTIAGWLTELGAWFAAAGKLAEQVDPGTYYLADAYVAAK